MANPDEDFFKVEMERLREEAPGRLVETAARFALTAGLQMKAADPLRYAAMVEIFNRGAGDFAVVVSLGDPYRLQLCFDIGERRHVLVDMPLSVRPDSDVVH